MNDAARNLPVPAVAHVPAPLVAGPWDHHRLALLTAAALAPALTVSLLGRAADLAPNVALALVVALGWTWGFARLRGRAPTWDWIATAMTFAILVPATVPSWQQALALSFGVVMGDLIFGGRGRNFLHPTTVALAFLLFSFPGGAQAETGRELAVAAGIGGMLLLVLRVVSWRVLVGVAAGAAAGLAIGGEFGDWNRLVTGAVIVTTLFLIADPVAAAATGTGRWAYGLMAGLLLVVFGQAGGDPGSLRAAVFAALLSGIFAPLIDQAVIWLNVRRRRRRG